ncbi:MAG: adaptor protein MecA [Lachnospiraceae bacterium]
MKIEKISDNQIRCTLTREDLVTHQINLSELAYGSDKAKQLFHDMMKQANSEFGFEADNIPLMIEAIPVNTESIILIITKVDDPEELDTRFSKFAPNSTSGSDEKAQVDGADSIINVFQKLYDAKNKGKLSKEESPQTTAPVEEPDVNLVRIYNFPDLDSVFKAARGLSGYFTGLNSLYKRKKDGTYSLVIHQSAFTAEEFNKVCNILSEYGSGVAFTYSGEAHLREHDETIISRKALQKLVSM